MLIDEKGEMKGLRVEFGAEERCPMKRLVLLTLLGAGLTRKVVADIVTMKDGGAK